MLDLAATRITWIDVESTGLSPSDGDHLLQVAAIVTDGNLEEVSEPFQAKVKYTAEEASAMREAAVPFVRDMHDATGLWDALPVEGESLAVIEFNLLRHLKAAGVGERESRLGGNSITLDRDFLRAFLPKVLAFLHYRNYDMTSVGGFLELFRPDIVQFEKAKTHDALDDIRESIAEARHYRECLLGLYSQDQVDRLTAQAASWAPPTA